MDTSIDNVDPTILPILKGGMIVIVTLALIPLALTSNPSFYHRPVIIRALSHSNIDYGQTDC